MTVTLTSSDFYGVVTSDTCTLEGMIEHDLCSLYYCFFRKVKLYGEPCSTQPQSLSQSSAGNLRDGIVVGGQRRGKFGKFSHSVW